MVLIGSYMPAGFGMLLGSIIRWALACRMYDMPLGVNALHADAHSPLTAPETHTRSSSFSSLFTVTS